MGKWWKFHFRRQFSRDPREEICDKRKTFKSFIFPERFFLLRGKVEGENDSETMFREKGFFKIKIRVKSIFMKITGFQQNF